MNDINSKTEKEPVEKIYTKLKFTKSDRSGVYVGFVSQNLRTKQYRGVRQDSPYHKKVCVLDRKLAYKILPDMLYNVTLIPMHEKNGFVVIEATPYSFEATIETYYIKKTLYKIEVKFGNRTIVFDPLYGDKHSVRTLSGCRSVLEKCADIKNVTQVIADFEKSANLLLNKMNSDGLFTSSLR